MNFVFPLIITICLEYLVYVIAFRKRYLELLNYSILINTFTNPLANLFYEFNTSLLNFLIIEFFVFFLETFLIMGLMNINYKKAILISLIANITSTLIFFII